MITVFAASLLLLVVVALLRVSWRRQSGGYRLLGALAWPLLALPLLLMAAELGLEFSLVYLCIGVSFLGFLFVLLNRQTTSRKPIKLPAITAKRKTEKRAGLRRSGVFFNAALLAGLTSCLLSLVMVAPLPLVTANRWLVAALLFPLLWALLSIIVCVSVRQWRLSVFMASLSASAYALLYL